MPEDFEERIQTLEDRVLQLIKLLYETRAIGDRGMADVLYPSTITVEELIELHR